VTMTGGESLHDRMYRAYGVALTVMLGSLWRLPYERDVGDETASIAPEPIANAA